MAVREGMMIARGEYCLFMDADGATRVSDMEVLEKAVREVQVASKLLTPQLDSTAAADGVCMLMLALTAPCCGRQHGVLE